MASHDETGAAAPDAVKTVRLALNRSTSEPVTIVNVTLENDGQISIQFPSESALEEIIRTSAETSKRETETEKDRFEAFVNKFISEMESRDLAIEIIPNGDLSIQVEFDMLTGRAVGRSDQINPYANLPEDLSNRIWTAISGAFNKDEEVSSHIDGALDGDDHVTAATIATSEDAFMSLELGQCSRIFSSLIKVNREKLDDDLRLKVLEYLISAALKLQRFAEIDGVPEELEKKSPSLSDQARLALRNMMALVALHKGAPETALSMWRQLLKDPEGIEAGERAWIYRNMASALGEKGSAARSQVQSALKSSFDSFLQSGNKREAARTLGLLARTLKHAGANESLEQYDEMLALMTREGIMERELRANVLHGKARSLLELGRFDAAKNVALEAVEQRRGLHGVEEELISSLHLAKIAADQAGDSTTSSLCNTEAELLEDSSGSAHFAIARRVSRLLGQFDQAEAEALWTEVCTSGDVEHIAGVGVARIIQDPNRSSLNKMSELERLILKLERLGARGEILQPARLAIATLLQHDGEHARAADWYRAIVADQPLDAKSNAALVDALWQAEAWGEAAIVLKDQLQRFGETPGRLFAYGRSLLEAGDATSALQALTRSATMAEPGSEVQIAARELRERAFELGGTIAPVKFSPAVGSVTFQEVQDALRDFALFVSSAKRMAFWRRKKGESNHSWISNPERFGQTLLHTFVKARFGDRVVGFEEIAVGAGRLESVREVRLSGRGV